MNGIKSHQYPLMIFLACLVVSCGGCVVSDPSSTDNQQGKTLITGTAYAKIINGIPIPDNAQRMEQSGNSITFNTIDVPEAMSSFYQTQLDMLEWKLTKRVTSEGYVSLDYTKLNRKIFIIMIGSKNQGTAVLIGERKVE